MPKKPQQLLKPLCPDCIQYDQGACPVLIRHLALAGNDILPHYCGDFVQQPKTDDKDQA